MVGRATAQPEPNLDRVRRVDGAGVGSACVVGVGWVELGLDWIGTGVWVLGVGGVNGGAERV